MTLNPKTKGDTQMSFIRRHAPSPSMVVASLALLFALGGSGFAAYQATVPKNSVGTAQLKNDAVTTKKVKNGTLVAADFKAGQIPAGAAGPAGPAGAPGAAGPAGPAGTGATLGFKVVTGAGATTTNSAAFVDVPGASASIDVPAGSTATVLARFTAESYCAGGGAGSYCSIRIVVDGNEAAPVVGNDFAFDAVGASDDFWESNSVERSVAGLGAGSHTVVVQQAVASATSFRLDDWSLSALVLKQ